VLSSLATLRRAAVAFAGPALIAPEAAQRLEAIPDVFGESITWLGLECRLVAASQVDLMIGMIGPAARARFAASMPAWPTTWADARSITGQWADDHGPLHAVPYLWLEFDRPADEVTPPIPFLPLEPAVAAPSNPATVRACAQALLGAADGPQLDRLLALLESARATGGWPLHLAPLRSRDLDHIRIVMALPRAAVVPWLRAVGWPGDIEQVATAMAAIGDFHSHCTVAIQFADHVIGGLGLDCYYPASPRTDRRWQRALSVFATWGVVPERLDAFARWHGEGELDGHIYERLPHTKISFVDGAPSVKAYLAIRRSRSAGSGR